MTNDGRRAFALAMGTLALGAFTTACDSLTSAPLAAITQAVSADEAATGEEVGNDETDTDTDDGDRDRPPPPGGGMDGGCGPGDRPPPGEGDFGDIDVPVCQPPVADDVELRRPPPPRGHLAAVYDEDESFDLSDEELASLQADLAEGCEARNAAALEDFDVDDSGDLSQEEWDTLHETKRAEHEAERAALDTDGDGEISPEEHEAARASLIEAWDTDGDEDLNAEERAAMREDLQALVRAGERLPPLPFRGMRHGGPPPDGPPPDDGEG